jgi:tetratricopeptide (TPR) repeat protein
MKGQFTLTSVVLCLMLPTCVGAEDSSTNQQAEQYLQQGIKLGQAGKIGDAISVLTKSIALKPSGQAYYNRGEAYGVQGQFDLAIGDFNQALRLEPNYPAAHQSRGCAFLVIGKYSQAIADFDELLRSEPTNIKGYWLRSTAHGRSRNVDGNRSTSED